MHPRFARALEPSQKPEELSEIRSSGTSVETLRHLIRQKLPEPLLERNEVRPSGVGTLDRLLEGGFPKSGITVLTGASGVGRMTLAAQLLKAELKLRRPVAWVDAKGTLYPPALKQAGVDLRRVLIVRGTRERALYALEQILDANAFGVVVGSGFESFLTQPGLRRIQTSTERSKATTLLILDPQASNLVTMATLKLRVARRPCGIQVEIEKSRSSSVGRKTFVELAA